MSTESPWTLELEHRLEGSPETVFAYFVEPDKYRRWKGLEAELDPRPGGAYRVTMAPDVWVRGEYLAVEPPHRLLMTWGFESTLDLPKGLKQVPAGSSTVEFLFTPAGSQTVVRVRHLGLPTELSHWAHGLGWKNYLGRLAALLEGDDPGEDPIIAMAETLYARDAETQSG
jgi:uncharacterized protein YndB with AHSA1/START domain